MQVQSFTQALRAHGTVRDHAARNEARAADVWSAVVGLGSSLPASLGEAIRDTIPPETSALVRSLPTAAAVAFGILMDVPTHGSASEIRDRVREAWVKFQARAAAIADMAHGFGWDLSDAWETTRDPKATDADMERVRRIGALAGRMYAALRGAAAKRVAGIPGEVYDVEQGNDLSRLLPGELAQLCEPILDVPVLFRLSQRTAAQYAVRGTAKKAKGPFVMAIDESSSMLTAVGETRRANPGELSRDDWSKAAAMALARVAAEDGRPVAVVHFSTSIHVQELRPRDPRSVLEMVRRFMSGGTRVGLALENCADQVRDLSKKGMGGADVIFVTDGVSGGTDETERALKAITVGSAGRVCDIAVERLGYDAWRVCGEVGDDDRAAGLVEHAAGVAKIEALGARLWTVAIDCAITETDPLRARAAGYTRIGGPEARDPAAVIGLCDAAKGTAAQK